MIQYSLKPRDRGEGNYLWSIWAHQPFICWFLHVKGWNRATNIDWFKNIGLLVYKLDYEVASNLWDMVEDYQFVLEIKESL